MKRTSATLRRNRTRIAARTVMVVCVVLLSAGAAVVFRSVTSGPPYRRAVAVVSEPVHIISVSADNRRLTILDIPQDTSAEAIRGRGSYSLASLYELDRIEDGSGSLFVRSLSDTLGLPVQYYVRPETLSGEPGSVQTFRTVFSFASLFQYLTGNIDTNIPPGTWLSWVIMSVSLSADASEIVRADQAFVPVTLPDGSTIRKVDQTRFDFLIGSSFIDTGIRAEGITVSVFNTTRTAEAGGRAARMMSKVGIPPVVVGNAPDVYETCSVAGTEDAIRSVTARFIMDYFRCSEHENAEAVKDSASDVSVFLGRQYVSEYSEQTR